MEQDKLKIISQKLGKEMDKISETDNHSREKFSRVIDQVHLKGGESD